MVKYLTLVLVISISCSALHRTQVPPEPLIIDPHVWEFGTIKRGDVADTQVTLRNTTCDTLRLKVSSSCSCLEVEPQSLVIPPGVEASLELRYIGDQIAERVTKTIFVRSLQPTDISETITVTGKIQAGIKPHIMITPAPIPVASAEGEAIFTIRNKGNEDLIITNISCHGCQLDPNVREVEIGGGESLSLSVSPLPRWSGRMWIEVTSNDPVTPQKKVPVVLIQR